MLASRRALVISAILAAFSPLIAGCAPDRSDARAISEATFRAIMAKDYQQLRRLVGSGGSIPTEQAWRDASFIRDATPSEGIKAQWIKGATASYALNEIVLNDWQGLSIRPERSVEVHFNLDGRPYVATYPVAHVGDTWSPGSNPFSGDFVIRFEEP